MFDAIQIGTTGLLNHAKGLRTVGNNLANDLTSLSVVMATKRIWPEGGTLATVLPPLLVTPIPV